MIAHAALGEEAAARATLRAERAVLIALTERRETHLIDAAKGRGTVTVYTTVSG